MQTQIAFMKVDAQIEFQLSGSGGTKIFVFVCIFTLRWTL
jgi:hypothetical protein